MRTPLKVSALLLLGSLAVAQDTSLDTVKSIFRHDGVVPDVLSSVDFTAFLDLKFTDLGAIHTGQNLTKAQAAPRPAFSVRGEDDDDDDDEFVIIALDPDAPSPQNRTFSQFLHFMAGGFTLNKTDGSLTNNTPAVMEYAGPNPPDTSLAHRYIFLLYESTSEFRVQNPINTSSSRRNFNLARFADEVDFDEPIAGLLFYTGTNPAEVGDPSGSSAQSQSRPAAGFLVTPSWSLLAIFLLTALFVH